MSCGRPHEVAEGADLRRVCCPHCGAPHERMVQLRPASDPPAYERACSLARGGSAGEALAALAEAFAAGYDDFERVDSDRSFASLRRDPRFADLMKRARSK